MGLAKKTFSRPFSMKPSPHFISAPMCPPAARIGTHRNKDARYALLAATRPRTTAIPTPAVSSASKVVLIPSQRCQASAESGSSGFASNQPLSEASTAAAAPGITNANETGPAEEIPRLLITSTSSTTAAHISNPMGKWSTRG